MAVYVARYDPVSLSLGPLESSYHPRCLAEGCLNWASFGTDKAQCCSQHRLEGQQRVTFWICQRARCGQLATHSLPGQLPCRCNTHALTRMKPSC